MRMEHNLDWRVQAVSTLAFLSDRMTLNQSFPVEWNQSSSRVETSVKEKNWPILLILVVIFFTVMGNTLLILAVSLEKKLQNPTSFFLRSLAVADLLVGLLIMPLSLINIFYGYAWPLPRPLCPIWISLDVLLSTASIMHLCAISLDRYMGICNPIKHSRSNSHFKAMAKIALVWTISIVISTPILAIGLYNEDKVFDNGTCVLKEGHFLLLGSLVAFFIPLLMMVVSYCLTVRLLQNQASAFQHRREQDSINHHNLPQQDFTPAVAASNVPVRLSLQPVTEAGMREHRGPGMAQSIKNERKASKVLGVVFFLFLVMWGPFFVTNVLSALCAHSNMRMCNKRTLTMLLKVFVWVGYVSSAVNLLVYTLFNENYRDAFKRYLQCVYHSSPYVSSTD